MQYKLKVPESLKEEHEMLIDGLRSHSTNKDETGAAVRKLLKLLEPHVEKENEFVLPLLGALGDMASGQALENPGAIMLSFQKYAREYSGMFSEHLPIRQAIMRARSAAKKRKGGHEELVDVLDGLAHHSIIEEEVLYPAALLVGKTAYVVAGKEGAKGMRQTFSSAREGDTKGELDRGLSYFALDYDAPISTVLKSLTIKHNAISDILSEVEELANKGKLRVAISLLNAISPLILRVAVEEEARVMRVVMQRNKSREQRSVAVTREHREIVDFLKNKLPRLESKSPDEARGVINAFVRLMRGHLREDEEVPFSLARSD